MTEGWRLPLRERPPLPVEVGALTPEGLASLSSAEIERLQLGMGRRTLPLAELFRVEGGPGPRLIFAGRCERLDGIGHIPMVERPAEFNRILDGFLRA